MNSLRMKLPRLCYRVASLLVVAGCANVCPLTESAGQQQGIGQQNLQASIEEVDGTLLERAEQYLAAEQWKEGVAALESLYERVPDRLVEMESTESATGAYVRYLPMREYFPLRLATLAQSHPRLLELHRRSVDPFATRILAGTADPGESDRRLFDELPLSSLTARAGLRWADRLISIGRFESARRTLERLSTRLRLPHADDGPLSGTSGLPLEYASRLADRQELSDEEVDALILSWKERPPHRLHVYLPARDLPAADVLARLVLISALQGDLSRARFELRVLLTWFPAAEGTWQGTTARWGDLLTPIIEDMSAANVPGGSVRNWPDLAGSLTRNARAHGPIDPAGQPTWSVAVPPISLRRDQIGRGRPRAGEGPERALSYHPILIGDKVVWGERERLRVVDIKTGQPTFPLGDERDESDAQRGTVWWPTLDVPESEASRGYVGVPRYTVSSSGSSVFARVGSPFTGVRDERFRNRGQLVGIDLDRNAALLSGFPRPPVDPQSEFDGTPISDGRLLYALVRVTSPDSARVELRVQAIPLLASGGPADSQPLWSTSLGQADTPALVEWEEVTHNVLSLSEDTLFCNTNSGIVAAIEKDSGRIRWLTRYPRTSIGDLAGDENYFRDLTPAVVAGEQIMVAPTDSRDVFAVDRGTGKLIWSRPLADVTHIVGVTENHVIAGGHRLWWIDRYDGRVLATFPRPGPSLAPGVGRVPPGGYGRGILVDDQVFWPTYDKIYVFSETPRSLAGSDGRTLFEPVGIKSIDLRYRGVTGGNLIIANGHLIIAGTDRIWAFVQQGPRD